MPGLDQAVLNVMDGAHFVKQMIPGRLSLAGGAEAIGKLLAVVGEDFGNCKVPCDYIPKKSYALFRAKHLLQGVLKP